MPSTKIFHIMIIESQQMAAIDLPGFSHMTPQGEGSYPGSGRLTAARSRVVCTGVNKGELERAVKQLPGYMQGFNVVVRHDPMAEALRRLDRRQRQQERGAR